MHYVSTSQMGALLRRSDDHTGLTSNRCSTDGITDLLAMHQHALSRHLKSSGIGSRVIANETRLEIARQLLQDTEGMKGRGP
jgi:AraC-like DNA-binding protein